MVKRVICFILALSLFSLTPFARGDGFTFDRSITLLPPKTKASSLDNSVFDGNRLISSDEIIKTGYFLNFGENQTQIAVLGDLNCDGIITSTDFMRLRRGYLGLYELPFVSAFAADVNLDGRLTSTDYAQIRSAYLGKYSINSAAPFFNEQTADGAIVPNEISAPQNDEICLNRIAEDRFLNYYFLLDTTHFKNGYFDLMYNLSGYSPEKLEIKVAKGDSQNRFIITKNLTEPFRFNFAYGDGRYDITAKLTVNGKSFTALSFSLDVALSDADAPFSLSAYPTLYGSNTLYVKKAAELCGNLKTDNEKIAACYRYICDTQTYKYTVSTNEYKYLPDLDAIYSRGYGVCWDFCASLAAMLRSQGIPCKICVGYAYGITSSGHAWLEVTCEESYEDSYVELTKGVCLLDITAAVCRSDKESAKEYIKEMADTYKPFKFF